MFLYALTYHQVAPEFLEYIFAFGWQEYQDDFHFSGFRESTRLLASERGLNIPALGRSGQDFRLCYALKSAEESNQESSPWSIRQTATYHSFEVDTGKMFWIFVKGNEVIRDRVQQSTKSTELRNDRIESTAGAFALTLETHLLMCEWATESWRWYINFLERKLQDLTRPSLAFRITKSPDIVFPEEPAPPIMMKEKRTVSWKSLLHRGPPTPPLEPTSLPDASNQSIGIERKSTSPILWQPSESPPPPPPILPPSPRKAEQLGQVNSGSPEFSIDDLQDMQSLEDKLNETSLVLISNTKVLQELKSLYESLGHLEEFPEEIKTKCQRDISKFSKRITNFISDLQMHQSRAGTLLRLLADRKTLVSVQFLWFISFLFTVKDKLGTLLTLLFTALRYPGLPSYRGQPPSCETRPGVRRENGGHDERYEPARATDQGRDCVDEDYHPGDTLLFTGDVHFGMKTYCRYSCPDC